MMFHRPTFLATLILAVPSVASACAVCFGGANASLVNGFFWGILILLVLPLAMTAGFIVSIVRASRRQKFS